MRIDSLIEFKHSNEVDELISSVFSNMHTTASHPSDWHRTSLWMSERKEKERIYNPTQASNVPINARKIVRCGVKMSGTRSKLRYYRDPASIVWTRYGWWSSWTTSGDGGLTRRHSRRSNRITDRRRIAASQYVNRFSNFSFHLLGIIHPVAKCLLQFIAMNMQFIRDPFVK